MFYALAVNEPTVNAMVDRAIMLAPCIYIQDQNNAGKDLTMEGYELIFPVFEAENVNVFAGPNLAAD